MSVVDASIVVRLLLNRAPDQPLRSRVASERRLHAPALIDAEVASAVRGLLLSSAPGTHIDRARAEAMMEDFAGLTLVRYAMQPLQMRVIELRDNLTAYDAFYVALAETLDLPLLTDDRKFARNPGHHAHVETWPPA